MEKQLSELKQGEKAIIKSIANNPFRIKLLEMGCFPGEEIQISQIAPLGCPFAVYVSGYELSLRKNEADYVLVDTVN